MSQSRQFFVIQRPESATFFDARTGMWSRFIDSVQHYQTGLRAAMDVHEWALEEMAVVMPYRITFIDRYPDPDQPNSSTGI